MEKGGLETFRLFVSHKRPLTADERRQLRHEFEKIAPVTNFFTNDHGTSSTVSFADTPSAVKARERLNGAPFHDLYLHVNYTKPTTRVVVHGFKDTVYRNAYEARTWC